MEFGRGSLEFLGSCTVAGRACYFVRIDDLDVLLMATPVTASHGRTFARGEYLAFEYRLGGDLPLSALSTAVLEGFTLRLLRQEERIAETLRGSSDDSLADINVEARESIPGGDGEEFQLRIGPKGVAARVKVGAPGDHQLALFRWAFSVSTQDEINTRAQGSIQQFLLLYCAHRVLGLPFSFQPKEDTEPTSSGREVFAYHAPARDDFKDGGIPELQEGDRLRLSFEVPTRCSQRCVFCVAWTDCATAHKSLGTEELLAAAEGILGQLPPVGHAVRIDVVLVGQDALTHAGFQQLLRLFRGHSSVKRITVVTPGTNLAEPGLAEELVAAGLDGIIMTLLDGEAKTHDKLAGRAGAHTDLLQAISNIEAAGLSWELNTVVLKDNQSKFCGLLEKASQLGCKLRVYLYTNEPMVPLEKVALCAPDVVSFATLLGKHRELVENNVESLHYAPLCLLPEWAHKLSSHASQSLPSPADPLPDACQDCAALGTHCPSVSAAYVSLFGIDSLKRLEEQDLQSNLEPSSGPNKAAE